MGSISRKSVIVIGSHATNSLLGLAVIILVGRYLTPGAWGGYIFATNLVGLVATIAQLGYGQAHTREIAQGQDPAVANGVFTRIRTITIFGYVSLFLLGLWVWHLVVGNTFTDATTLEVVLVILLSSVIGQWRRVATATWRGQGRVHRVEWGNFVDAAAFAVGVAVVALAVGSATGRWMPLPGLATWFADLLGYEGRPEANVLALHLAFAHLAGRLAAMVLYSVWWVRDRVPVGPWDWEVARRYTRFAFPMAFTGILSVLLTQTDIIMLGFFWDSHEVGLYDAGRRLAKFGLVPTIALRTILFPHFARLMGQGKTKAALRAFHQAEKYLLLFVVPLGVAMMVWAEAGIHIAVGDRFAASAQPLRYLALWTILLALGMPVRLKHLAAGNTKTVMRVMMVNVAGNLLLNLIFIPRSLFGLPMLGLGATGSAMATVLATTAAYAYNRYCATRDFGIPLADAMQARLLGAGAGVAALWLVMRLQLPQTAYDRVHELAAIGLIGIVVYFALLWLVRGLRKQDIRFFTQALRPKGLVDEMRGRGGGLE